LPIPERLIKQKYPIIRCIDHSNSHNKKNTKTKTFIPIQSNIPNKKKYINKFTSAAAAARQHFYFIFLRRKF
jgi:hypothetical protein